MKLPRINRHDIAAFLSNAFTAVLKGEFLLRLRIDKLFPHIVYTFIIFLLSIWLSIKIDSTFSKVEYNKTVLNDLEIYYTEKTNEIVRLNRFSTIQDNLARTGSNVTVPEKPAATIKKR